MESRFESFTFLIDKIDKIIQKIKNFEIKEFGLKAIHIMCIHHLNQNAEGLTSKRLVDLTLEDKAAISRSLALLKRKDIILYDSNKYKGKIKLTDYGRKVAEYIKIKVDKAVNMASEGIDNIERITLYKTLRLIGSNLEHYYISLKNTKKGEE